MPLLTRVRDLASATGGAVLAAGVRAKSAVTPSAKPLHPDGTLRHAVLHRHGLDPALGVAWLDEAGVDEVVVRESRAVGLPDALPDIQGLAIRIPVGDGHGDLLLASTGLGRVTRFLLTPSRTTYGRPMTTLLPYRTVAGAVLIAARAVGPETVELSCAVGERAPAGDWRHFADLRIAGPVADGDGERLSFDPVRNRLPGLGQYRWVERLREPGYQQARADRSR
ncbi:hypothetical protein [Nocardioides pantholopis]|uniref:hypothetical protein n=1 Tax=Nocardioides pantholopis TaxID=2483798 RepID=UPI000F0991ED|nr:hypothetical protein [Nocardioides pantholopis]